MVACALVMPSIVAENAVSGQTRVYSALGVNSATFIQQAASTFVILARILYMVEAGSLSMGADRLCCSLGPRFDTDCADCLADAIIRRLAH